jgi:hypothetical protein
MKPSIVACFYLGFRVIMVMDAIAKERDTEIHEAN